MIVSPVTMSPVTVSPETGSPDAAVHQAGARAVTQSRRQLRFAGEAGRLQGARRLALPCGAAKAQPGAWFRRSRVGLTRLAGGGGSAARTHPLPHPRSTQGRGHTALCLRPHPGRTAPRGPVSQAVPGETRDATVTLLRLSPSPRPPVCRASQAFQPSEASSRSLCHPSTVCPASSAGLTPQVGPTRSPGHCLRSSSVCQALYRGSRARD